MSFEITGRLVAKYNTVQRTETFKTREFVIEHRVSIHINHLTTTLDQLLIRFVHIHHLLTISQFVTDVSG